MYSIDVACICQNEQEALPWMLRCCETLLPNLRAVILVDGGSHDNTLDVIRAWKSRVPIALFHHPFDSFMEQKNRALEKCSADYIVLADSDMTWTSNLRDVLDAGGFDGATFFDFPLYYPIVDFEHYETASGHIGASTRMCKNIGARYVRPIHEYLVWPGEESPHDRSAMERSDWDSIRSNGRMMSVSNGVVFFENSLLKSDDALLAKADRYAVWRAGSGQAGIPIPSDREFLVKNRRAVIQNGQYNWLPQSIREKVVK